MNSLVGWRAGVKVGAKSKLNNYASFILLLNFPPFTLASVYIKKNLLVHLLTNGVNWAESENDLLTLFQFDDIDGISGKR